MGVKEFVIKKTRASLTWFVCIVLSIVMIMAAFNKEWITVQFLAPVIAGIALGYQGSQAYTKGQFIKKVGEAKVDDINKTIEP